MPKRHTLLLARFPIALQRPASNVISAKAKPARTSVRALLIRSVPASRRVPAAAVVRARESLAKRLR